MYITACYHTTYFHVFITQISYFVNLSRNGNAHHSVLNALFWKIFLQVTRFILSIFKIGYIWSKGSLVICSILWLFYDIHNLCFFLVFYWGQISWTSVTFYVTWQLLLSDQWLVVTHLLSYSKSKTFSNHNLWLVVLCSNISILFVAMYTHSIRCNGYTAHFEDWCLF